MGWLRVSLPESEQQQVLSERESNSSACVRRRMLVLWSLHCGLTREQAAKIAGVGIASVGRDVRLYRRGGLNSLLNTGTRYKPTSEMADYADVIRASLEQTPVRTIVEARQRILDLTGLDRRLTQVRVFLKSIGLKWQRVRAIPVPPQKVSPSMLRFRPSFWTLD